MSTILRVKPDPEVLESLGAALAARRVDRGWRQADLAERAGVALRTVQHVEGGVPIRTDTLLRLFRALQLLDRFGDFLAPSLEPPAPSPLDDVDEPPARRCGCA
jgi:transcriptional regulator with XRE-family HTH domain